MASWTCTEENSLFRGLNPKCATECGSAGDNWQAHTQSRAADGSQTPSRVTRDYTEILKIWSTCSGNTEVKTFCHRRCPASFGATTSIRKKSLGRMGACRKTSGLGWRDDPSTKALRHTDGGFYDARFFGWAAWCSRIFWRAWSHTSPRRFLATFLVFQSTAS